MPQPHHDSPASRLPNSQALAPRERTALDPSQENRDPSPQSGIATRGTNLELSKPLTAASASQVTRLGPKRPEKRSHQGELLHAQSQRARASSRQQASSQGPYSLAPLQFAHMGAHFPPAFTLPSPGADILSAFPREIPSHVRAPREQRNEQGALVVTHRRDALHRYLSQAEREDAWWQPTRSGR